MRLEALRKKQGLSQRDVAERMGLTQTRVSQIESSDIGTLKTDTLRRYATALGLELEVSMRDTTSAITVN